MTLTLSTDSSESLVGASGYKFNKADKKPIKLKLKKIPGQVMKESDTNGVQRAAVSSSAPSPVLPQFDEETMANFPDGRQEALDTVVCKHCKKMVLKRTAKDHIALCIKSKQDKARKKKEAREAAQRAKERAERADEEDDDEEEVRDGKGARKNAVDVDADDATKKGKKRKAEPEEDKDSKKKKRKEEQKKAAKPKGPVDVEKQCGVTLPNGAQCARSLTCKSHSMGAKRAVPGRSLPYDMLLAAYQKKNQARQQKAAIDANAPAFLDEDLDPTLAGPVDSDEERDSIMTAISRSLTRPHPLISRTLVPTKRKYQLVRMKEMLSNALSGNRSGGLFSVPPESVRSTVAGSATNDTFSQPMSASAAPTGASMAQPGLKAPVRKRSVDVT
ncbi:SAGA-associated factor 73 [Capronia epimyces CBS 606.96]|uniref:SAGA-associated factor 73 n=1 Tax=Capronia epimyces CBS 606.96 TaxID=1182542 RepID=W9YTP7_9EURO|nr:SAGA-associated factor 73 [Capronia epimyces CBS 606.96]EXJ93045.1 SAGA-associated factor 73 [Capronia epimyces CBS 606.96]